MSAKQQLRTKEKSKEEVRRDRLTALPFNRFVYQFDMEQDIKTQTDLAEVLEQTKKLRDALPNGFLPRISEAEFEVGGAGQGSG